MFWRSESVRWASGSSKSISSKGRWPAKARSCLGLCFRLGGFCCHWGRCEKAPERNLPPGILVDDPNLWLYKQRVCMTAGSNLDKGGVLMTLWYYQCDHKTFWMWDWQPDVYTRAPAALAEVLDSVPRTHGGQLTTTCTSSSRERCPLLAFIGTAHRKHLKP